MPATLNEHTQFVDSSGAPLVNGKVYFGDQNADPVANPQTIFSDRGLTTIIANPQILDADGRTTNKVWIAGRYSIRVDDLNDVQQYQELDNGETASTGVTQLENVLGGDVITATATTTITSYADLELFVLTTASANTGPVTLNIDFVGADAIVKNFDQPLVDGDFEANQVVIVVRNNTNGNFEWVNHNDKVVNFSEGTPVVSATVTDIWANDGNTVHVTGDTGPIMSFGVAPNVGAVRWVIFDGTPTLSHSANLNLPGGVDFIAAAGDFARVYADTTVQLDVQIFKADGTSVAAGANQTVQIVNTQISAVATGTTTMPLDDTIPQNTEGNEYMTLAITPKDAANLLIIEVIVFISSSAASNNMGIALFQDTTADAIAVSIVHFPNNVIANSIPLRFEMAAGTTSSTIFKIRVGGGNAGTTTFNGRNTTRSYGDIPKSSIFITEVTP